MRGEATARFGELKLAISMGASVPGDIHLMSAFRGRQNGCNDRNEGAQLPL